MQWCIESDGRGEVYLRRTLVLFFLCSVASNDALPEVLLAGSYAVSCAVLFLPKPHFAPFYIGPYEIGS
jgi:hypothetical protein